MTSLSDTSKTSSISLFLCERTHYSNSCFQTIKPIPTLSPYYYYFLSLPSNYSVMSELSGVNPKWKMLQFFLCVFLCFRVGKKNKHAMNETCLKILKHFMCGYGTNFCVLFHPVFFFQPAMSIHERTQIS